MISVKKGGLASSIPKNIRQNRTSKLKKKKKKMEFSGSQWLGLCTSTSGDAGWIPGWEAKLLQATQCSHAV